MRNTRSAMTAVRIGRFMRQDDGQDLMEYGLLASLIAAFLVGTLTMMGETVQSMWTIVANGIQY